MTWDSSGTRNVGGNWSPEKPWSILRAKLLGEEKGEGKEGKVITRRIENVQPSAKEVKKGSEYGIKDIGDWGGKGDP